MVEGRSISPDDESSAGRPKEVMGVEVKAEGKP